MNKRQRIVVGNWKMYVDSLEPAKKLAATIYKKSAQVEGVEAWLAPAFPFIAPVAAAIGANQPKKQKSSKIKLGAQMVSAHTDAPHTGDVSTKMLKALGVSFVIVGHSERRAAGESDEVVHEQLAQILGAGLTAILCVGEVEREPDGSHFQVIANQLNRALREAKLPASATSKLVVAYEPVWAIGKQASEAMQGSDVEEMAIFIRKILSEMLSREAARHVPILYGGSVEAQNAAALIQEGGIQGLLVGHASADAASFIDILKAVRPGSR